MRYDDGDTISAMRYDDGDAISAVTWDDGDAISAMSWDDWDDDRTGVREKSSVNSLMSSSTVQSEDRKEGEEHCISLDDGLGWMLLLLLLLLLLDGTMGELLPLGGHRYASLSNKATVVVS